MKVTCRRSRGISRRILPFVMSLVMVLTINTASYAAGHDTDAPAITTQPASQAAEEGQPAGFSVEAEGTEPLSYQWQKDGNDISKETSTALDIPNARGADSGGYTVVVTDAAGNSVTSDAAALTVIKTTIFQGVTDPSGVAVDSSGNIYIADSGNNAIKKMDADGNIVTLGSGFNYPCGVAVDGSGNIYIADTNNDAVKRMDADGSNIVTLGSGFNYPCGVAVDGEGNIYVADTMNNAVKKVDAEGNILATFDSDFSYPSGVAVDGNGNIYVADSGNNAVKKMDADGSIIATFDSGFNSPFGVAVDSSGNIHVADSDNNAVKKMDADGNNIMTLGSGFDCPCGVAVDNGGNIYVADSGNNAVKKMDADGSTIETLDSGFNSPCSALADGSGNIYIADSRSSAVKKIDADDNNIVTLGWGFINPWGVAVDSSGNIYVTDSASNNVKKMDGGGNILATFDSGFSHPSGVAADGSLVKAGYVFTGWNTAADGSGTSHGAGAVVTMPAGNLTLYAIWEDIPVVTDAPSMVLGTSGIEGGGANWIYYGENSGSPVKWRVLDVNNDYNSTTDGTQSALFLLSEYLLTDYSMPFDSTSPYSKVWQGSTAQGWCGDFYKNNFDPAEQFAIAATTKTDNVFTSSTHGVEFAESANILSNDKVFFLSAQEAETPSYGFASDRDRRAKFGSSTGSLGVWWLRSPRMYAEAAGTVDNGGCVGASAVRTTQTARPALNLDLSAVLFSSAAADGKSSGSVGADALNTVSTVTPTEWKLTLEDSSRRFAVAEHTASTAGGGSVTLHYSGATVYNSASAPNEYISALIVDASDKILYYGRLAQPASANGAVDIGIPSDLAEGSYTLKAFSEQYNGDYETDYAGAFSDISLTVDNTAPMVSAVTPIGPGAAISDNIKITFSEELDTDVIGTVTLGGATYTNAGNAVITVSGNTVTVDPADDFAPDTEYTGLTVSGFKDAVGNLMAAYTNPSYHFVTEALTLTAPTGLAWDVFPGKAKWSAVDHASGYNLQLYKGGTAQGSVISGVTALYYDFTSAIASAGSGNYTFKVTALGDGAHYTNSDQSAESDAYSYTAPTTPTAPQNFSATPGDRQVSLSWAAPASDGGVAITKYEVSKDGGSTWIDVTSGASYTFTGLTNGQSYTFEVQAVNDIGTGTAATVTATPQAAAPTDKTLVSITTPTAITGVANGTAKTASALGLPAKLTLVTDDGNMQADVTWDVASISYVPDDTAEQTFTVNGTVTLPSGVINPDGVSLGVSISVTVNAAITTDKTLVSVTTPTAITGVANGTAKTASALGLPAKVTLVTDGGNVQADVGWDVASSSYDPDDTAEQTFMVDGTVTLPSGVINPDGVSLGVSISVTVNAAITTDKTLVSVTTPTAITGVANGTAKTAAALGLPSTVTLVTNGGNVSASVSWDVASSTYNASSSSAQTFTVNGTVSLPVGVINPDKVSLSTSIRVTVNAGSNGGGGGGGGGGAPSTPSIPDYKAHVDAGNSSDKTLPVTVNKNTGSASIDVSSQGSLPSGGIVITVPSIPNVDTYSVGIPIPHLSTGDRQGTLTLNTDTGSVTVSSNMLAGVDGISGSQAQVSIGRGDKDTLPANVKSAIGDRPLVQLTLSIDGNQTKWSNPGAPVTVSIPYTPTAEELKNPASIVIWYIDGSGNAVSMPNGRYDPAAGTVTFFTTHFSSYAITYVDKTFSDLGSVEWAKKAIKIMAAKGITNGTGADAFSPAANVTRADYIILLIKTLGLTVSFDSSFDDVQPSAYYYGAVGVAKKLGITAGAGDNLFKPTENISRQDMMVLTARALEKYQGLKAADTNATLDRFSDESSIADYAVGSLATLVSEGLIEGSGNNINPRSYTTRAEAAVFLYNIYNRYPDAPTIVANADVSSLTG